MKVRGKKKLVSFFYILGYLLELSIKIWRLGILMVQNLAKLSLVFAHEKSFWYIGRNHIFQVEIIFFRSKFGENSPAKEDDAWEGGGLLLRLGGW
jgi:hypothetical protein